MTSMKPFKFGEERGLFGFSVLVMFATLGLLYAGGMVTSTGSGLAVPDWPLSYGQWFPPMVGGVYFETGHRIFAKLVGLLTIVLAIWLLRSEVGRRFRAVRLLGPIAVVGVLFQGLLGGITVIYLLPPPVSILHAVTGQTFFCLMVAIAFVTSRSPEVDLQIPAGHGFERLLFRLMALVYCQLILGAIYRHTKSILWLHVTVGVAIAILAALLFAASSRIRGTARLSASTGLLAVLVLLQLLLGLTAWQLRVNPVAEIPPPILHTSIRTLHQTMGGLILGAALWMSLSVALGPALRARQGAVT